METENKSIVIHYSCTGNTEAMAKHIQELTGADMFKVETIKAYPESYHETTEVAKMEKSNNARPEIKGIIDNINQYNTVFIGFPIWWGTFPMAIATFLESYELESKIIVPFCSHGGGGVEQGFKDIQKLTPKSIHKDGLSLYGSRISSTHSEIGKWLRDIKAIN